MTVIYRGIVNVISIGSLLILLIQASNCQVSNKEEQFTKAIEYWTETLCTLQKTRTFVFHGIFLNSTSVLRDFFNVLLRTTSEYCGAVVLLKIYTLPNFRQDRSSNIGNSNTLLNNVDANQHTRMEEYKVVKRQAIRRLVSMLNFHRHKWNIKRCWRKNDEYRIDVWTVNVVFLGDSDSFEKLLDSNPPFQWNSREHFFVLAVWNDRLAELTDRRPLIDRTLRRLWLDYQIQNVYFGEPLSSRDNFNFYSYNPFVMNERKAWGQLECVDGSSKRRMLRSLSTLTYRRAINFNGYQFNVSIFDQAQEGTRSRDKIDPNSIYVYSGGFRGPTGILLGVLAKKLNFAVNVIEPNTNERYGHQMENGTLSGAVGDVVYRRVVASFASFFVKKYADDMSGMEFTATTGFDQVCVIVPKAAKVPKGLRMFHIFKSNVWLCMTASYILLRVTWHYVQVISSRWSKSVRKSKTCLRIFYICTGYPVSLPSSVSERCLVLGILICGLTLVGIFNGMLYTSFATNMFYKDINNFEELDASQLPIGFFSYSMIDIFGTKDDPNLDPVLQSLRRKMVHVLYAARVAAYHRNVSGLVRDQYFSLIYESLIDKTGTHMLHRVKECPGKFYLACLLPSNSFLRERINIMIGRLNQAGLPPLWRTRSLSETAIKMKVNIHDKQKFKKQVFVAFQLSDLQISFFILGAGLLSSIIVFFTEKGWIRLPLRRRINESSKKKVSTCLQKSKTAPLN